MDGIANGARQRNFAVQHAKTPAFLELRYCQPLGFKGPFSAKPPNRSTFLIF